MFVGHYAAAFALKGKQKNTSLGMLFIATQFVDILFFPFVVLGIEELTLVENFTDTNNLRIDSADYTHGLLSSMLWGALFYALYYFLLAKDKTDRKQIAWVMALGVVSHWFVDLVVHTPDLSLIAGDPKVGFGLWNNKTLAFVIECIVLAAGWWYYVRQTDSVGKIGKYASLVFMLFLVLVNHINFYVLPEGDDIVQLSISALLSYFLLALIAHFVDRTRA